MCALPSSDPPRPPRSARGRACARRRRGSARCWPAGAARAASGGAPGAARALRATAQATDASMSSTATPDEDPRQVARPAASRVAAGTFATGRVLHAARGRDRGRRRRRAPVVRSARVSAGAVSAAGSAGAGGASSRRARPSSGRVRGGGRLAGRGRLGRARRAAARSAGGVVSRARASVGSSGYCDHSGVGSGGGSAPDASDGQREGRQREQPEDAGASHRIVTGVPTGISRASRDDVGVAQADAAVRDAAGDQLRLVGAVDADEAAGRPVRQHRGAGARAERDRAVERARVARQHDADVELPGGRRRARRCRWPPAPRRWPCRRAPAWPGAARGRRSRCVCTVP